MTWRSKPGVDDMHWSPWATVLLQQSRAFTGICGLQRKCFPQMHHQQTGDPTPQLQPFCSCSCSRIPAFHSQRASLFTSLGALSFCLFCLFRLISSLLLVRKGHEDQDNSFLLPSLQNFFFFLVNGHLISFLSFIFLQSCGD